MCTQTLSNCGHVAWKWKVVALITFNHDLINLDLDMLPTGTFTIHTHLALHDTTILCTLDGRAVTTLSGSRIRHLFQLFRPDLTHRSFYHLITRLDSRSEIHSPTPVTTTHNRWATREDLLTALRSTFHIQTELYSDPLNKSLNSHSYHSLYP
jgi:hypothetical protein